MAELDTDSAVRHLREEKLLQDDCLILKGPSTQPKHATCFRVKWKEHQRHTRADCFQSFLKEARSFRRRRRSAAAEAAKCCQDRPAGLGAGITYHCLKAILTVHFLVQVKSFFQLILLFVPLELPLLLLLHTSNGFLPDPVKNNMRNVKKSERGRSCYLVLLINTNDFMLIFLLLLFMFLLFPDRPWGRWGGKNLVSNWGSSPEFSFQSWEWLKKKKKTKQLLTLSTNKA